MDKLCTADRKVLSFQAVERCQKQFRFPIVHLPDITADFRVAELSEDVEPMMAVTQLVYADIAEEQKRLIGSGNLDRLIGGIRR